jgi:hypothetical protein
MHCVAAAAAAVVVAKTGHCQRFAPSLVSEHRNSDRLFRFRVEISCLGLHM